MSSPYESASLSTRSASSGQRTDSIQRSARGSRIVHGSTSFSGFSIEAVARRADDVARMTIYHQFGSEIGLLEALCDSLAVTGDMEQAASAFRCPEFLD